MARKLAERILREANDDESRLHRLFTLIAARPPKASEQAACRRLLETMANRYKESPADATALLSVGDSPQTKEFDPHVQAAWTQLAITVLASDMAILLY